jgi:hypothetical protein
MESDKERHARVWGSAPFERAAATIADMHDALVASFEPHHHAAVASELARVTCPGGRLGLTSWLSEEDDDSFEEWMGGTVGLINGVRRYQRLEGWQLGLAEHSLRRVSVLGLAECHRGTPATFPRARTGECRLVAHGRVGHELPDLLSTAAGDGGLGSPLERLLA